MLLPILGLTWVFGLLAVNSATIVFQYLFTVFNSFQGLFIFLINCAFNSEVSDLVVITPDRDPYKFLFFWINLELLFFPVTFMSSRTAQLERTKYLFHYLHLHTL